MRHGLLVLVCRARRVAFAATASASELIDRNAHGVKLAVNAKGEALDHLHRGRQAASTCSPGARSTRSRRRTARPQVAFKLDYAGGWGKYHRDYWKTFAQRVRGLRRAGARVEGDRVQGARRLVLGAAGVAADAAELRRRADAGCRRVWELRLSHWTGDLPVLDDHTDWAWHQWDHLFGTFTYGGTPVYGFSSTSSRRPARHVRPQHLRRHVRLGVRHRLEAREQLPDAHAAPGSFCYGFNPHGVAPAGKGTKYRATVEGPGRHARRDVAGHLARRVRQGRSTSPRTTRSRALGDKQCKRELERSHR